MKKMKILVTDGMDKTALAKLRENGHEVTEQFYPPEELGEALRSFDAVVVRSATKIRKQQIDEAKGGRLKLVIRGGVGVDNIDVSYAEDQLLGRDVISAGYIKAYAPRAAVLHSNEMTVSEYDDRMFEETQGLREVGIDVAMPSIPTVVRMVTTGILKDTLRLARDREVGKRRKISGFFLNPAYHVQKWRGVRRGVRSPLKRYGQ